MLASNGNTKPLLASLGLPPRRYLQTGGKAPEGFAPSSPTLKVGNFLLVHSAYSSITFCIGSPPTHTFRSLAWHSAEDFLDTIFQLA